jgi:methyl-accepting chemotaxis protein
MNLIGGQSDISREPMFLEPKAGRTSFGPVQFRKESEPYITIAMAGSGAGAGVMVAEVNLKFIWDAMSQIKIGKAGHAYVVDSSGRLIAHPDISLVLKKTDLSSLPQVRAALAARSKQDEGGAVMVARDLRGTGVLTAFAPVPPLGWWVFLEQSLREAFEPLTAGLLQSALLVIVSLAAPAMGCLFLVRRKVTPIKALQAGAARIGAGELAHRIQVRTDDELETLADEFNRTAARLQESYEGLERKVEERTRELSESLERQTATAEILRVISSSPTDIQPVLDAVAESAARLCESIDCQIYRVDGDSLRKVASYGSIASGLAIGEARAIGRGWVTGRAVVERQTIQVHDLAAELETEFPEAKPMQMRVGFRTTLGTPPLREGVPIGAILIRRMEVRPFSDKQVELLKTFADQAVIAIENVRLFQELQARTGELGRSLEELKALGEVGQAVSSTLDLQQVLTTISPTPSGCRTRTAALSTSSTGEVRCSSSGRRTAWTRHWLGRFARPGWGWGGIRWWAGPR